MTGIARWTRWSPLVSSIRAGIAWAAGRRTRGSVAPSIAARPHSTIPAPLPSAPARRISRACSSSPVPDACRRWRDRHRSRSRRPGAALRIATARSTAQPRDTVRCRPRALAAAEGRPPVRRNRSATPAGAFGARGGRFARLTPRRVGGGPLLAALRERHLDPAVLIGADGALRANSTSCGSPPLLEFPDADVLTYAPRCLRAVENGAPSPTAACASPARCPRPLHASRLLAASARGCAPGRRVAYRAIFGGNSSR